MKHVMKQTYLVLMLSVSAAAIAVAAEEKPADPAAATQAPAAAPAPASRLPYAWQPAQAQFVPVVKQKEWVRTPIDAFILSKLEAKGLKPSPDADRATFIRRATLDVWGVVPTPEEVAAALFTQLEDGPRLYCHEDEETAFKAASAALRLTVAVLVVTLP